MDEPQRPRLLASYLRSRFLLRKTQRSFDDAVRFHIVAAMQPSRDPRLSFLLAEAGIQMHYDHPDFSSPGRLMHAYSCMVVCLADALWVNWLQGHYEESSRAGELVSAAVCAAIEQGNIPQAIVWLEAGRSVTISHVISRRAPLDDISECFPEQYANALHAIRLAHQHLGDSLHSEDQHRKLMLRQDTILREIRSCDGYENFMRPKLLGTDFTSLGAINRTNGTIIFINVAQASCHSLILFSDGTTRSLRLQDLSKSRAYRLRSLWVESICMGKSRPRRGATPRVTAFVRGWGKIYSLILSRLWTWIVAPVLSELDLLSHRNSKAHITWCPTGPLTELPIHAAGIYDQRKPGPRIFDFVVSSYTSDLSAFLRCLETGDRRRRPPTILTVTQSNNLRSGLTTLHHVHEECARIQALFQKSRLTVLENEKATAQCMLAGMDQHDWVHIACHGSHNALDPSLSSIELYDKPLTVADLFWKAECKNAPELAFLSACETATAHRIVSGESGHIAMAMLVAGFKGVVATMWAIYDEDGPIIADAYYKKLLKLRASGVIPEGSTGAAYALHHAVECLRNEVGESNFERWVPFVHFGV